MTILMPAGVVVRIKNYSGMLICALAVCLAICAGQAVFAFPDRTPIFDWNHRGFEIGVSEAIMPLPQPGHDYDANDPYYTNVLYPALVTGKYPLSIMLRGDTGPSCGWQDSHALETVMDYLSQSPFETSLSYVLADVEDDTACRLGKVYADEEDVLEMIAQVRSNKFHAAAHIGSYAWYPGEADFSQAWPENVDRSYQNSVYLNSGLDIAMPNCFPYAVYSVHTDSYWWGTNVAPNIRAAIFWAPLERISLAARELPEHHLLIPWIAGYIEAANCDPRCDGRDPCSWSLPYPYEAPPFEDMAALLKHLRMRGAHGYVTLDSGMDAEFHSACFLNDPPPTWRDYTYQEYREDMLDVWTTLDDVFDPKESTTLLNLETDKTLGVQASGVLHGENQDHVTVLISNLRSDTAVEVKLPSYKGMPSTITVPCNTHFQQTYGVDPPDPMLRTPRFQPRRLGDVNHDGAVNVNDWLAVYNAWGSCPTPRCTNACSADLDFDGTVGASDLLIVIYNFD